MSQVIIISNRLPVSVKKENGELSFYPSLGGLATGLASYVKDRRNTWIGWPGIASDELTDDDKQAIVAELGKDNYSPVFLSQKQIDNFYNGFSNSVLWPAFHTMARGGKVTSDRSRWWRAYRRVNQEFAQAALNLSESGGQIWVHDYQLMLVPQLLREERQDISSGFFLHIPFPAVKSFEHLSESKRLLRGMLGADVLGFHTFDYVNNFLDACESAGLGEIAGDQIYFEGRLVRVGDFPMGIDYEKYASANKSSEVRQAVRQYRERYKRKRLIVSVDRLDPSKGLVERLSAYKDFLKRYPRARGRVVLSMVAAPSRTDIKAYQNLSRQLAALAQDINRTYGTPRWQPVDYINTALPFKDVAALFQLADVAFITPLRDGMNLVAKEFVASASKNGVLILSETAGASHELPDAILVNPRQPETLVDALHQALTMRRRELQRRLRRMQKRLSTYTVQDWARDFITTLQQPVPGTPSRTRAIRDRLRNRLVKDYRQATKRLLLLDYDGSLVPFSEDYQAARPPKTLINTLSKLCADPANDIVMISGRSAADLQEWFGKLPISLVAEHGASVKKAGHKSWRLIEKPDTRWKPSIQPILEKYAALTPGARVEVKPHTLVWHYRAAPPYYAQKYAVTIKRIIKPLLKAHGLEMMQGNKILEIKNPQISKGEAARFWLDKDYDFIFGLGDDLTDEELFAVMPENSYSIKVGRGRSRANYRLPSHKEVLKLLNRLARV
jgi:trehalose 6-phosphate synthase/phosphatase